MSSNKLPYEKYRVAGDLIFVSGQLPIDPTTGEIVSEEIKAQANQIMINISQVLEELDLTMNQVVKMTCFLTDMNHFEAFNQVYAEHFGERFPARSAFQVVALPKDALIEIEWVLSKA
ncbi:Rid family detoxifying hydrolase [Enterococcus hirae]|uniref:Rid family detoxifying hydrolase n=1 Tax=Enterococcus hirae TaxID=1354 RepID=UPI0039192A04